MKKKSSCSYQTFDSNFVGLRLFDRGHHPFTFISILFTRFPKCFRRIVIEAGHDSNGKAENAGRSIAKGYCCKEGGSHPQADPKSLGRVLQENKRKSKDHRAPPEKFRIPSELYEVCLRKSIECQAKH